MKKLLSLFAILGLAGFVIAPIYAQEEDAVALDEEPVIAETEEVDAEDFDAEEVDVEDFDAEEVDVAEDLDGSFEQFVAENPEIVSDLNAGLDEFLGALEEENEGITDEFNAQFTTDEERAAAAVGLLAILAGFGLIG